MTDATIWTLQKGANKAAAKSRAVVGVGVE